MRFSQVDQEGLLAQALAVTASTGWRKDAIAWGVLTDDGSLRAVAVFQNFDGEGADFHFGMIGEARIGHSLIQGLVRLSMHPRAMNLPRLMMHIDAENRVAQAAALKIGASFEARIRGSLRGGNDVILMALERGDAFQRSAETNSAAE